MQIPGMRNFFGKKLGSWVSQQLGHMSPIDLHSGDMAQKISATRAGTMSAQDFGSYLSAIWKGRGDYGARDWAKGLNVGDTMESLSSSLRLRRQAVRVGIPSVIGLASASSLFGDNPVSTVSRTAVFGGAHVAAAGALGKKHWGLGAAYAAWGGLNMVRSGDNFGPF